MIFVFGSNKAGIHGAGSAKYAKDHLGAVMGVGEGRTGECYALPTKGFQIEFISLEEVEEAVTKFINHAKHNQGTQFKVTQVGCGLGGFNKDQIAPLFLSSPSNCYFDLEWEPILGRYFKYWGSFPK